MAGGKPFSPECNSKIDAAPPAYLNSRFVANCGAGILPARRGLLTEQITPNHGKRPGTLLSSGSKLNAAIILPPD